MIFAETISTLIDAGLSGETLKTIVAALERDLARYVTLREQVTPRYAQDVSPAALRMRKMREKQRVLNDERVGGEAVTVTSQGVTSYNNPSSSKEVLKEESKKESIVGKRTRLRPCYAEQFEKQFWPAFPTDKGMSKAEAGKVWDKLSQEDRDAAVAAIPGFKKWVSEQGATYRVVHACRYLSQRRFDGFLASSPAVTHAPHSKAIVVENSEAWQAWKRVKPTIQARDIRLDDGGIVRGWYFPTQFPEGQPA